MGKTGEPWRDWGERLRTWAKANGIRLEDFAQEFPSSRSEDGRMSESGLRHWLNGQRRIELEDFFKLCTLAGANPAYVLFGDEIYADAIEHLRTSRPEVAPGRLSLRSKSPPRRGKLPRKTRPT